MQRALISKRSGFTIVELLIVIVVIAILAAIVIVAYSGITKNAQASAAQSTARDLAQLLAVSYTNNNAYPNDLSTVNNGGPMPTSNTTYAYHPGSGNASYCATITNGSASYKITNTATAPVAGGCPGDGQGGVAAITNLATNPSFETDASGYAVNCLGSYSFTVNTSGAFSGNNYGHLTTNSCSNGNVGPYEYNLPVTAGSTYTATTYLRASPSKTVTLGLEWHSASQYLSVSFGSNTAVGSSWTRLSSTAQAPAGAASVTLVMYTTNGSTMNSGDTMDVDATMLTAGSSGYNFADGNSPNWLWNGTANSSSSTGPPQ